MIGHLLTRTCTIQRWATREPDSEGITRPSFSNVATAVPYARQEKSGRYLSPDDSRQIEYSSVAYFAFDADIQPGVGDSLGERDRIVDDDDSKTYYVVGVVDQVGLEEFKKVLLKSQ